MLFNLFFILQLVLRILHVLLQILTQSTPNSQQIKPINLVNKPIQIKPRSRNQSQQTQKNTLKPKFHHPTNQTKDPPYRPNQRFTLQQNVSIVTNFSEENFFITKKYHIVTKFKFCHYIYKKIVTFSDEIQISSLQVVLNLGRQIKVEAGNQIDLQ